MSLNGVMVLMPDTLYGREKSVNWQVIRINVFVVMNGLMVFIACNC